MTRDPSGAWLGSVDGRNVDLQTAPGKLSGEAADLTSPTIPQFVLALLAVLPM